MANKKISELPYIGVPKISGNTLVPLVTYFSASTGDTVHTYISDLQTYLISGITGNTDVFVTGGTYSAGTITITNNTGGTFNITGVTFSGGSSVVGDYLPLSGGTVSGNTQFTAGLTANTISATTYLNLPINTDVFVTGGTYSSGDTTFTNNTGGTFTVTGFYTGETSYVNSLTTGVGLSADTTTGNITIINTDPDQTVVLNNGTNINVTGTYPNFTIDVTGLTDFNTFTTGFTYSSNTFTITDNSGNTFDATFTEVTGLTVNGNLIVTGNTSLEGLTATTISATTYQNLPDNVTGNYLPLSGGTVTGQTFFTSGVSISGSVVTSGSQVYHRTDLFVVENQTINGSLIEATNSGVNIWSSNTNLSIDAENRILYDSVSGISSIDWENRQLVKSDGTTVSFDWENGILTGQTNIESSTISATTYQNLPDNVTGNYLPLSGGTVTGDTIFTSGLTASTLTVTGLTQTKGITSTGGVIFPEKTLGNYYTATTEDYYLNVSGGTFDITLPSAVPNKGRIYVIKNEGSGIINVLSQPGETIDDRTDVLLTESNSLQTISNGINWVIVGYNISTTQSNTGVIEFSGLSKVSSTQFSVSPVKGYVVDDTTNPVIPFLTYIDYSGGTFTDSYVTTDFETFVYITSGGTIGQQPTPLTEQQRRQNIFLGKIGHPEKISINLVFSQPDFVISPLSQFRDIFAPINLINGGVYPSANGANLKINTSAGNIYGLGINFSTDKLNPNAVSVSGTSPCTFQYRTQTGGTVTNVTDIDPLNYDVAGVKTPIGGTKATNQRIFLLQNGTFRVQYGQQEYNTMALAIEALQTETFTSFPNFVNNAVLIGILTVLSTASDLTDTAKARFFFASKFGETVGATGGVSTTNLQQAYNNSSQPEIIINSTLDGLSIKNGTGSADNVTKLLEGLNTAGTTTSFINADGSISGFSFTTAGFSANTGGLTATTVSATTINTAGFRANTGGLTATTISATTYQNLPNSLTGLYLPTSGGTVSGNTIFTSGLTASTTTINGNLTVTGNTNVRAFTGTTGYISGSGQNILTVIGSGNSTTPPLFTIQGSSGELFSVNDSLVGSLFSVNDISGLPILEVFSDNTTLMGSYQAPSLNTTTKVTLTAGTNTVYSIPTSAYTGAFIDYTLISTGTTGARAGNIMTIWSGTTAQYTETSTNDIGTTTGVTFTVAVSGSNAVLSSSATTAGWTVKTIIRSI